MIFRVFKYGFACLFLLLSYEVHTPNLAPSDDLTFTLSSANAGELSPWMKEEVITSVFQGHLSLFPKSWIPKLTAHLVELCKTYRFDPAFVLSLIYVESRFQIHAVSSAGAVGLMQLMPGTARFVSRELDMNYLGDNALRDPFYNLTLGVAYLSMMRDRYFGFPPYYLAAYNMGPVKFDQVLMKPSFKPNKTKIYYERIRNLVSQFRTYNPQKKVSPDAV